MLRIFSFLILSVTLFGAAPSYSMMTNELNPGLSADYDLNPNDPQLFINFMFWTVDANCKISTQDEGDDFLVEALSKKGRINGTVLSAGNSMVVRVHNGDNLKLSADSGAKVKITNLGEHSVKASCSV